MNSVHIYTLPFKWLIGAAARYGLRVMIGLPIIDRDCGTEASLSIADSQGVDVVRAEVKTSEQKFIPVHLSIPAATNRCSREQEKPFTDIVKLGPV